MPETLNQIKPWIPSVENSKSPEAIAQANILRNVGENVELKQKKSIELLKYLKLIDQEVKELPSKSITFTLIQFLGKLVDGNDNKVFKLEFAENKPVWSAQKNVLKVVLKEDFGLTDFSLLEELLCTPKPELTERAVQKEYQKPKEITIALNLSVPVKKEEETPKNNIVKFNRIESKKLENVETAPTPEIKNAEPQTNTVSSDVPKVEAVTPEITQDAIPENNLVALDESKTNEDNSVLQKVSEANSLNNEIATPVGETVANSAATSNQAVKSEVAQNAVKSNVAKVSESVSDLKEVANATKNNAINVDNFDSKTESTSSRNTANKSFNRVDQNTLESAISYSTPEPDYSAIESSGSSNTKRLDDLKNNIVSAKNNVVRFDRNGTNQNNLESTAKQQIPNNKSSETTQIPHQKRLDNLKNNIVSPKNNVVRFERPKVETKNPETAQNVVPKNNVVPFSRSSAPQNSPSQSQSAKVPAIAK